MPDAIEAIKVRQTQACLEQDEAAARACADLLEVLTPTPYPPFPTDGICPTCSSDNDWQVQEAGYMRFTSAQMEPDHDGAPYLAAFPNGASDYSEGGDEQWVTCVSARCENDQDGAVYAVPEHLVFG